MRPPPVLAHQRHGGARAEKRAAADRPTAADASPPASTSSNGTACRRTPCSRARRAGRTRGRSPRHGVTDASSETSACRTSARRPRASRARRLGFALRAVVDEDDVGAALGHGRDDRADAAGAGDEHGVRRSSPVSGCGSWPGRGASRADCARRPSSDHSPAPARMRHTSAPPSGQANSMPWPRAGPRPN